MIIANYELNKEYISRNLCENKAKPQMKCNGKCHLKKQLQKEDKKENSAPTSQKGKSKIQFFSYTKAPIFKITTLVKQPFFSSYLFSTSSKHLSGVFHPPQILKA